MKITKKQMRKAFLYCLSTLFFLFFLFKSFISYSQAKVYKKLIYIKRKSILFTYSLKFSK